MCPNGFDEDVTLPKRSKIVVAMQVEGNFDQVIVAVVDPRNKYLGNTKGVLLAKPLIVLNQCNQVQSRPLLLSNMC